MLSIKSGMQAQVNAAATAAADAAQSCGGPTGDIVEMRARALSAARAVGFTGNDDDLTVSAGLLEPDVDDTKVLRFSQKDPVSEIRQTNAALVTYTRSEPLSRLLPQSLFEPVQLTVNAAARKEVVATLSAAGSTAEIQGGLLGSLIGELTGIPSYSLDATSLQSIESTLVGVGDLLDNLGVADLSAVVDEPLIDVLEAVRDSIGGVATPAGGVIDDLTGAVGVSGLNGSAVFDIVGDASVPNNSSFPLYDLLTSVVLNSVRAANESAVGLLSLQLDTSESSAINSLVSTLDLLGEVDVTLDLIVDEPPRIVFGPARQGEDGEWLTRVRSADISVQAGIDVTLATSVVGDLVSALSLGLINVTVLDSISIPLAVQVGGGESELIAADCARGDNNTVNMEFSAQSSVVAIETGGIDPSTGAVSPAPLELDILRLKALLLPEAIVCVSGDLGVALPAQEMFQEVESYSLYCPDEECSESMVSEGSTGELQGLSVSLNNVALDCGADDSLLDLILGPLLTPLTGTLESVAETVVEDVTGTVLGAVLSPLLSALGADLGGMSVKVIGASQERTQIVENVEL
ncbi:MAG: hypothetical protein RIK85_17580 [Marinobacter sp.]